MKKRDKKIIGVVLLNLGGPDSLQAVRPFLYNLFSDRDIIRLGPALLQKPLAWLISTLRSKKSEKMYGRIGGKSPILDITKAQARLLEESLNQSAEPGAQNADSPSLNKELITPEAKLSFRVFIGMRYWHPFMRDTIRTIRESGIKQLVVLSLYPHYSKATTGSSVDDFRRAVKGEEFEIKYIEHWYDFPAYIDSLAELISKGSSEFHGRDFQVLYSAHSLPQSFIDEGDPYLDHIQSTIGKINQRLSEEPYEIRNLKWRLSFQSKTGPVKWLEPSTEETIIKIAGSDCRNVLVVPISFVSDHIETLYEIDIEYGELAEKHGIQLRRCESLNTSGKFISALKELVLSRVSQ